MELLDIRDPACFRTSILKTYDQALNKTIASVEYKQVIISRQSKDWLEVEGSLKQEKNPGHNTESIESVLQIRAIKGKEKVNLEK